MSVRRKIAAAAAAMLLMTGIAAVAGMTPASASSGNEVCDQGSPIHCLNAWGGGPTVRTYTPNVSNNNFLVQGVDRCGHGDYSYGNCPIPGNPSGLFIYQLKFVGGGPYNNLCVGVDTPVIDGLADLVGCNHTGYPGTGGGTATIFVAYHGDGLTYPFCDSGFNYGVNVHFTNQAGGSFGGLHGIRWDEEQNDISIDLSFPLGNNCLAYIPFG
jgi:hypothetical protein